MLLSLALLIVLGLVAWRLVRGIGDPPAAPPAAPVARSTAGGPTSGTPAAPAARASNDGAAKPVAAVEGVPPPSPSSAPSAPVATPTSAPLPPGAGSSMRAGVDGANASAPGAPGDKKEEGLRDRTGGWGQAIIRQLNKELMPLASECIDQAVARNPKLEGSLALDLVVVPVDAKKAIVESVSPSPYNQIKDDELVECIRQSSFAMEGLDAPYNFTLSMPIKPASQ